MNSKISLLIVAFLLSVSCKSQTSNTKEVTFNQTRFNSEALLKHIEVLSSDAFEGRRTGSAGSIKAKDYITTKYKSLNVLPLIENYEQAFTFKSRNKSYNGINILGYIKGTTNPDKYIVLSAHYDHEGIKKGKIYNGADDDASGISGLLAFAEYFKKNPPNHSVILAAFDAEELGLRGAKHFVETPIIGQENILLNINMDMISRNDNNELYVVGANLYKHLQPVISKIKLPENFSLLQGHDGLDGKQNWVNSSDHAPFHKKGIPFLYFGEEDHKDYHRPTDDYENIQPNFFIKSIHTIISAFEALDDSKLKQ